MSASNSADKGSTGKEKSCEIFRNVSREDDLEKKIQDTDKSWDWLSLPPSITWNDMQENPPWDWLSLAPSITWKDVQENPEEDVQEKK